MHNLKVSDLYFACAESVNLCTKAEYVSIVSKSVSKVNLHTIMDKIAKFNLTAKNTYLVDPKSLEESFVIMI